MTLSTSNLFLISIEYLSSEPPWAVVRQNYYSDTLTNTAKKMSFGSLLGSRILQVSANA